MKKYILSLLMLFVSAGLFAQLDRSIRPTAGPAPKIELGKSTHFTLKNGLKVYVIENHKLPKISASISVHTGPILEKNIAGYVTATGELMMGGTQERSKDELNETIDFMGASLNASARGVSVSSLSKYTDDIFALMSEVALQPKFNENELEKWKTRTKSGIKSNEKDPKAISAKISGVVLYGKEHVYGEFSTEATVDAITLEDCESFYNQYFKPNIAYMAIVGDITPKQAKKLVKKYFGKWEDAKVIKEKFVASKAPAATQIALFDLPTATQSVVRVTYPIDLKKGHEDVLPMSVLNQILGNTLYTNRHHH